MQDEENEDREAAASDGPVGDQEAGGAPRAVPRFLAGEGPAAPSPRTAAPATAWPPASGTGWPSAPPLPDFGAGDRGDEGDADDDMSRLLAAFDEPDATPRRARTSYVEPAASPSASSAPPASEAPPAAAQPASAPPAGAPAGSPAPPPTTASATSVPSGSTARTDEPERPAPPPSGAPVYSAPPPESARWAPPTVSTEPAPTASAAAPMVVPPTSPPGIGSDAPAPASAAPPVPATPVQATPMQATPAPATAAPIAPVPDPASAPPAAPPPALPAPSPEPVAAVPVAAAVPHDAATRSEPTTPNPAVPSAAEPRPAAAAAREDAVPLVARAADPPPHRAPVDDTRTGLRLDPTEVPDPRTTLLEKAAFVLSVVVAPLGLIASIVAATTSARRRGWVPSLVSAGIVVGSVLTVLGTGGIAVGDVFARQQLEQRQIRAESQPMCRSLTTLGLDATSGDFGWPAPGDSIDSTLSEVRAYANRWRSAAAVAPDDVRSGLSAIAAAADQIAAGIASTRTISDADNTTQLQSLRSQSAVPAWVVTYCD